MITADEVALINADEVVLITADEVALITVDEVKLTTAEELEDVKLEIVIFPGPAEDEDISVLKLTPVPVPARLEVETFGALDEILELDHRTELDEYVAILDEGAPLTDVVVVFDELEAGYGH